MTIKSIFPFLLTLAVNLYAYLKQVHMEQLTIYI